MLTGFSFVRSCFLACAKKQGWGLAPGEASGGARHIFFTPLRSVKKIPGCPLRWSKGRAGLGHPWPIPSRPLRLRRPIIDDYRTHPLTHSRPRPPLARSRPRSALHNRRLCKLPPPPSPTPPRSRAADRPRHRAPAPRSWVPWSRFRGSRRSTWPPSRTSLRAAAGARPTPNLRGSAARSDVGCGCPRAAKGVSRPYKSAPVRPARRPHRYAPGSAPGAPRRLL